MPTEATSPASGRSLVLVSGAVSLLLVAATVWVLLAGLPGAEPTTPAPPPVPAEVYPAGTPAPPLRLPALDGGSDVDLAQLRGQPVVVNFWASWCAPCRTELPLLTQVDQEYPDVAVVGVAVRDDPAAARALAAETGVTWPSGLDADGTGVAAEWGVAALPQTFYVNADGTLAARQPGELTADGLRTQVDALDGSSVTPAAGRFSFPDARSALTPELPRPLV